jgi:hypothetical protein
MHMNRSSAFFNRSARYIAKVSLRASSAALLFLLILGSNGLAHSQSVSKPGSQLAVASSSEHSQLSVVPAARFSPPTAAKTPSQTEEDKSNEVIPNDASHQGIKVHGHWVVDVKNPDGTLAQHREFENSLVDLGEVMTYLLSGSVTAGEPAIFINPNGIISPCNAQCTLAANPAGYWANTSACTGGNGGNCFYTVTETPKKSTITLFGTTTTSFLLVISGQMTAPSAGFVSVVATGFATCQSSNHILSNLLAQVTPAQCVLGDALPSGTTAGATPSSTNVGFFTQTALSNPVQVAAGQVILVTVTLSFS